MDIYLAGTDSRPYVLESRKRESVISMDLYLAGLQGMSGHGRYVLPEHTESFEDAKQGGLSLDLYMAGGINGNCKPIWTETAQMLESGNLKQTGLDVIDEYTKERAESCGHISLAANWGGIGKAYIPKESVIDIAILESFYYADKWTEALIPKLNKFLLDSGAFTFMTSHKGRVDWNEYLTRYIDFINRNDVNLFFELDIDSIIGYENVLKLRKRLENETGKKPIPVWHKSRGKQEFLKMCDEYKYVSIGGIVSKEITRTEYKYFPWFINEAHKRGAKIHGLGFTNLEGLRKYKFDSVDSTAWTTGNRFGSIYRFNGYTMEKSAKAEGQRLSDSRAVAINNFNEWVKFQKYAELHL